MLHAMKKVLFLLVILTSLEASAQIFSLGVKADAGSVVTTYGTNTILTDNNWSNEWHGNIGLNVYTRILGLDRLQASTGLGLGLSNYRLRTGWDLTSDVLSEQQSPLYSYSAYRIVRKNLQLIIPMDIRLKLVSTRGFLANHNFYLTGGLIWRINANNTENIYAIEEQGNYESNDFEASSTFKNNLNDYFSGEFTSQNLLAAVGFERGRSLTGVELIYSFKYIWNLTSMTKDLKINNSGGIQLGVGIRFGNFR